MTNSEAANENYGKKVTFKYFERSRAEIRFGYFVSVRYKFHFSISPKYPAIISLTEKIPPTTTSSSIDEKEKLLFSLSPHHLRLGSGTHSRCLHVIVHFHLQIE